MTFVICINNLTAKDDWQLLIQVIYFVNQCEAMFSTKRLKIFKLRAFESLLETNLASSVKPSNTNLNKMQRSNKRMSQDNESPERHG